MDESEMLVMEQAELIGQWTSLGEDEDEKDGHFPSHMFTMKYFNLLKSFAFLITFNHTIISCLMVIADLLTDILQVEKYLEGDKMGGVCNGSHIGNYTVSYAHNMAHNNQTVQHDHFEFETNPWWPIISLFSLFLPAIFCIIRYSANDLLTQYVCHKFSVRPRRCHLNKMGGALLLKLVLVIPLPILIVARQVRKLVVKIELEYLDQKLSESIGEESTCSKIIQCLKHLFCCSCVKDQRNDDEENLTHSKQETDNQSSGCCMCGHEDDDELKLVKAVQNASLRRFTKYRRALLIDELTNLSGDCIDRALVETLPQTVLNLLILFRYGNSDTLRFLSIFSSLYALGSSITSHYADKLRANPVQREFNHLGKYVVVFLSTFPAVLSRCVVLSLLYSIPPNSEEIFMLKWTLTAAFFFVCGGFGFIYEYWNLDNRHLMPLKLFQHLFLRGVTSIFILPKYRTKGYQNGRIIDEADNEAVKIVSSGPKTTAQIIHLFFNSLINLAFALWFFPKHGLDICGSWHIHHDPLPYLVINSKPLLWTLVTAGAPISLLFTCLMRLPTVYKLITSLGIKPIEFLNIYIRSVLKDGNQEEIGRCLELIETLSQRDRERVAKMDDPRDKSVLSYALNCDFSNGENLDLLVKFHKFGFPVKNDLWKVLVTRNNKTLNVSDQTYRESAVSKFIREKFRRNDVKLHMIFKEIEQLKLDKFTHLSLYPIPTRNDAKSKISAEGNIGVHSGNFVYIWGGIETQPSELIVYNIKRHKVDVKQTKGDIPVQRVKSAGCIVDLHYMYIFGGIIKVDGTDVATNDMYCLDINTLKWGKVLQENPLSERSNHAMWCWKGDIWTFGGQLSMQNVQYNNEDTLHHFHVSTKRWHRTTPHGSLPSERFGVAHTVHNDSVYIYAGKQNYGFSNQLYRLQMADDNTLKWAKLHTRRALPPVYSSAICIRGDELLILGGNKGSGNESTLYSYKLGDIVDDENVADRSSVLLTLPDLVSGESSSRSRVSRGSGSVGIQSHHMFFDEDGDRVIVLGGRWGTKEFQCENNFVVECDFSPVFP